MSAYRDELRAYAAATDLPPRPLERAAAPPPRRAWGPALLAVAAVAVGVVTRVYEAPPEPVTRPFLDAGEADLGPNVHVAWTGSGAAGGDARTMELVWEAGDIDVEVTPDRGVALTLTTGEATVRVVGTGFAVRRDAFGTGVTVRHGVVGVTCAASEGEQPSPERRVEAGGATDCQPVTAAALLGRARAQMRRGDPPEEILASVRRARVGADAEVAGELGLIEAYELSRVGEPEAALAVAATALEGAPPRRVELLRLATRLAFDLGGCERAEPYATALAAAGEPTPCPAERGP